MSIVTKTGDKGTTALMYGRRVSKTHPRIRACGAIDELNAALGLARAHAEHDFVRSNLLTIQKDLIAVMGELATSNEDLERYTKDGYSVVTTEMIDRIERLVTEIEGQQVPPRDWVMPGETIPSAAIDLARTACRRAEREVCGIQESGDLGNPKIIVYLNRLADLMWLFARWIESNRSSTTR